MPGLPRHFHAVPDHARSGGREYPMPHLWWNQPAAAHQQLHGQDVEEELTSMPTGAQRGGTDLGAWRPAVLHLSVHPSTADHLHSPALIRRTCTAVDRLRTTC